ncbi:hypothetical protein SH611_14335 [Geminicoccaceae bacterium 1502E]|nr:hypothetical protein [Geminicoccaceae bacterium 1502E]
MRRALIASGVFHVLLALVLLIGMPRSAQQLPMDDAISVEVVTAAPGKAPAARPAEAAPQPKREAASPNPTTRPEPKVEPKPAAPPKKAPEPAPAPPPQPPKEAAAVPPPPAPAPKPRTEEKLAAAPKPEEPKPEPKKVEPKPEPKKEPEPKKAEPKPEPKKEPEPKKAEPKPEPKKEPEPKKAEPKPEPKKEPEPKKAEPKPEPKKEPEPKKVEPKPEPKKEPEPKKAEPKPEPKKEEPPKEDSFAALLKSVQQQEKRVQAEQASPGTGRADPAPQAAGTSRGDSKLSMAEISAVRRQIEACWSIPAGLRDIDQMQVKLRISMNRDGSVNGVAIEDRARLSADPTFRTVAESAQRAVLSCRLTLPAEKYDQWREMLMTFYPKDALSG